MEWILAKWAIVDSLSPFLMKGLITTFKISMIAIVVGSLLGFILGILKTLDSP